MAKTFISNGNTGMLTFGGQVITVAQLATKIWTITVLLPGVMGPLIALGADCAF